MRALARQRNRALALERRYYLQWQCELRGIQGPGCGGSSGVAGNGARARALQKAWELTAAQVNKLTKQIQRREAQLTATDAAAAESRLRQAKAALPEVMHQLRTAQGQLNAMLDSFSTQNSADNGLLIRMEALDRLASNDSTINVARLLLFLLFLTIECLPVTVKLLQRPGDYEKILARRIIDARLRVVGAAKEQVQLQRPAANREEHPPAAAKPQDTMPARASSGTEPLTVPDHLRNQIESIYPFMKDTGETTAPAYREELENCFLAISQAVNELRRRGFDSDQIAEALRITANVATLQLAAAWQAALEEQLSA
jgi:hypothetical protein